MNVRHPSKESRSSNPQTARHDVERRESTVPTVDREIESKVDAGEAWLECTQSADGDFDIAAWFALEPEESQEKRCIAECWYG